MLAAALYIAAVNVMAIAAFAIDERRAERGRRRTPESDLQFLALVGGTPGAWLAMHLFRHKSSKHAFQRRLERVTVVQLIALAFAAGWTRLGL